MIDEAVAEVERLRVENARLTVAIRWVLGEEGDFEPYPEGRYPGDGKTPRIGRYHWRTELRQRAFGETT